MCAVLITNYVQDKSWQITNFNVNMDAAADNIGIN
jgi:hypothetical protein